MPWYYAGLDAKPVGPITLEELQARRANGVISPDTYIIEYVGAPNDARAWKRYSELFPALPPSPPSLAPVPLAPVIPPPPVAPPVPLPPAQAHPLFPSAASHHVGPHYQPPAVAGNSWCNWGFWLGLSSLILLMITCGLGAIFAFSLAVAAFIVSCIGLAKVQNNQVQSGRNLAFGGLFCSAITLIIAIIVLAVAIPAILKGRGLITTTEQSTSDS